MTTLDEESGCWTWQGARAPRGYGAVTPTKAETGTQRIHRFIYKVVYGDPGPEFVIDHKCHNESDCRLGDNCPHRRCWNPEHLQATTDQQNKDNAPYRYWGERDTCSRDHEYTEENTYRHGPNKQWRQCRACREDRKAIREAVA